MIDRLIQVPFVIAQAEGEIIWGAPQWVLPTAIVAAVLCVFVLWSYAQREAPVGVRLLAATLKVLAILLIAVCLLQPMRSGTRPRPQANLLPILVDNSQSMQLKATDANQSRYARVAGLIAEDAPWRVRVAQSFDVRPYAFDARLESIDDVTQLKADGYVSSLAGSLQSLGDRFRDRPVAGAVMFTDGNLTDLPEGEFDWSSLGFPVYPVLPKSDGQFSDLRIADVSVRQTDFESAPTTVTVSIDAVGMDDRDVVVQLKNLESGKLIEEKTVSLGAGEDAPEARFRFRPEKTGVSFFQAIVFREQDREAVESLADASDQEDESGTSFATSDSTEATLLNNRRIVTVDRAAGPYRILYVAGRPNWEFKFMRRALQEDAEVQLVALLRIANKEPKFSFRDKEVNDTNPLFAGLGGAEEEAAQQYDEPVIIRLGVKESEELSDGFPETAEELFAYHGVILDDIESEFFTQDQMLLLRKFVSARGGGLLLLGGQESFDSRKFGDSPLGELSPLYAPRSSTEKVPGPYRLSLTREGLLQPWARLRDTEIAEQDRIQSMPDFMTLNAMGDVKPGASVLATVTGPGDEVAPAIAAQRFGKGRTAAIPLGDLWRWSMRRGDNRGGFDSGDGNGGEERDDPAQAWRQLSHWLVNDVPRRVEVRVEKSEDPSKPVTLVATARDEAYLPLDNADVELTITPLSGEPFTLKAEMDDTEAGKYTASYWSRQPGGYAVDATVTGADGATGGEARSGWTSQAGAAEFQDLPLNRELLERIAKQTGGEVIREDRLDQFAAALPTKKVPVTETWVYPIWHRPWVMFVAMLCLCCEWGLRRWKGLA